MLQLLLERGQSYADLAELLGVSEEEVRTRAFGRDRRMPITNAYGG